MHTASRGGGGGDGGGGGGGGDDGARQARRCVWRCATGTHGYLLAETRPPCSRRRCWSICTGGKSSTWSLVIHGSLQPSTHSASSGSTPESQHAFGSGGSTGQLDSRQQRPPAVKLASIAGGPSPTPLTSHMRWAAGLTKVHATHASVLRQSASQPPAPPKIGWQAPRWLSRLSHVHGSPFTAGSVVWCAPRRRRRAARTPFLATRWRKAVDRGGQVVAIPGCTALAIPLVVAPAARAAVGVRCAGVSAVRCDHRRRKTTAPRGARAHTAEISVPCTRSTSP